MSKPPAIENRISSGGVVYRVSGNSPEVVLISPASGKAWCLPKGLIDRGEDEPTAALREVREETGLTGEIAEKIGRISYWFSLKHKELKIHKTVHFFLMKYIKGSTDDHDHEVDEVRWFPIDEAIEALTYKSEKEIMQKVKGMIEKKPGL